MTELLTAAQMRAIEQAAIESGEVTGLELMERAGQGVVEAIFEEWPEQAKTSYRAVVLCGPGNNGGDGFVVARLLKEWGWEVEVFLHGEADKLPPDARVNYKRWCEIGVAHRYDAEILMGAARQAVVEGVEQWLVVDALFGIGQRAPLNEVMAPMNRLIDATFGEGAGPTPFFVAIDIPTGYDVDTGATLAQRPMPSDLIVTFHSPKPIHEMPHMADARLMVVDIGLPDREA